MTMGTVLLRLWLIASVCWIGLVYFAFTNAFKMPAEPDWLGFAFGPPVAALMLGSALKWAFSAYRQR